MPSTPDDRQVEVECLIAETDSGPESSNEAVRASPPLMIRRMLLRGASCMPTLRLLVTTVSRRRPAIARATATRWCRRSGRPARRRRRSPAAASAIRRFSAGCWEARSPIGCSTNPPGRPTRPQERATAPCCSSTTRVAPDRGRRDRAARRPASRRSPVLEADSTSSTIARRPLVAGLRSGSLRRFAPLLDAPATMPSTIQRLRKKTISAGTAIATIAAALMIV